MMHLSQKKLLLILSLGLFLTLGTGLGLVWSQHVGVEARQKQELNLAQLKLIKSIKDVRQTTAKLEALKQVLAQTRSEAAPIRASLIRSLETIEFNKSLFEIARASGVEITSVALSTPDNMKFEGISCKALRANVRITGSQGNILDFIHSWTLEYITGVVVSVNIAGKASGEGPDEWELQPPESSASLELLIYSYKES